MTKSSKGFTLIELIVVIAILAILAGIALPVYKGYIKRAEDASVLSELDAIHTAARSANATTGPLEVIVVDGEKISVGGVGRILSKDFNSDFGLFYYDAFGTGGKLGVFNVAVELGGSYAEGAIWKNGEWLPGTEIVPDQNPDLSGGGVTCEHTSSDTGIYTAPTCTSGGYTTHVCDKCGLTYRTDQESALGHSWVEVEHVDPVGCTPGTIKSECSVCNETKTDEIPANHNYKFVCSVSCSDCGESRTNVKHSPAQQYGREVCSVCGFIFETEEFGNLD